MSASPLISVIVPFFNVEDYATECVSSLRNQTIDDIEIICVDDGSKDRTPAILKDQERADPRVRVVIKENGGAGSARNTGLDLARGKYLSILDSDDIYEPTMLETAFLAAEFESADVTLYTSDQYIQKEGVFKKTPWVIKLSQIPDRETFDMQDIASNRFFSFQGWSWDKLFRRSFIENKSLRFQNTKIYNDMYFVFSACLLAKRITYIDDVLIHQRKRGGGSLSDKPSPYWSSLFDSLLAVSETIEENDMAASIKEDFDEYVSHMVKRQLSLASTTDSDNMKKAIEEKWSAVFPVLQSLDLNRQ